MANFPAVAALVSGLGDFLLFGSIIPAVSCLVPGFPTGVARALEPWSVAKVNFRGLRGGFQVLHCDVTVGPQLLFEGFDRVRWPAPVGLVEQPQDILELAENLIQSQKSILQQVSLPLLSILCRIFDLTQPCF